MFSNLKCSLFLTQPATACCAPCVDIPNAATEAKGSRMSSSVSALPEASGEPEVFHSVIAAKPKTTTTEGLSNTTTFK